MRGRSLIADCGQQCRLADARLAGNQHDPAPARLGRRYRGSQPLYLGVAPYQRVSPGESGPARPHMPSLGALDAFRNASKSEPVNGGADGGGERPPPGQVSPAAVAVRSGAGAAGQGGVASVIPPLPAPRLTVFMVSSPGGCAGKRLPTWPVFADANWRSICV